jgi:hypothetical protein
MRTQLEPGRNEAFAVPLRTLLLFDAETGDAAGAAA